MYFLLRVSKVFVCVMLITFLMGTACSSSSPATSSKSNKKSDETSSDNNNSSGGGSTSSTTETAKTQLASSVCHARTFDATGNELTDSVTYSEYDKFGNVTSENQDSNGDGNDDQSVTLVYTDDGDHITHYLRYTIDSITHASTLVQDSSYIYDSAGHVLLYTHDSSVDGIGNDDADGLYDTTVEYRYDLNGNLLELSIYNASALVTQYQYTYDSNGGMLSYSQDGNGDGTVDSSNVYTRDSSERVLTDTYTFVPDSNYNTTTTYAYPSDTQQDYYVNYTTRHTNCVSFSGSYLDADFENLVTKIEFTDSDCNGSLNGSEDLKESTSIYDGSTLLEADGYENSVLNFKETYSTTTDADHNTIYKTYSDYDGDTIINSYQFEKTSADDLLIKSATDSDNNGIVDESKECEYSYE